MYFWHQGRGDGDTGMKHMENRTETVQAIQQRTVELDDDAASGGRCSDSVHLTGGDNDDIIHVQIICFIIDDGCIRVFNGHDNFGVGMPVQRVIFTFRVHMNFNFKVSAINHGFMNSIQSFNQRNIPHFFLMYCMHGIVVSVLVDILLKNHKTRVELLVV